ncbi:MULTISPECIES: tRNA (adenosine(37)-N6)-threonylcarbamoyltransferase complex dimerization subunit type 1 TsaB [Erysipelothrix]|uniref:tRNA (Adenosine(37)-N6)-threonylcarbamoyltransferase complex dimerization subunit type 1 TsaB n=1 Tax=Erysipelothrix piscisicarius TaxID=2485784 RepID=A0A3S8RML2_9FIRM|nr:MULTISPECIES: tRNA (adenosine(37)-N6)-threonylcarbamoyltransferase complex dimerization subunit type 1 TsaB [Erysipelothrix]AZK44166.1 tRNA (adenosine(37)-N6)-threonylcarbamoyltransferase complex dimerization subunit type 1 TsaB [Erysipelothrix piscisicarius]MBK2402267.1 tRNA (adenosine(37)-N6)-threonylcarbamoyltransferase complex dimerization subunit type 1 TsaB [Erysipelothrix sp. strain 2 (EsS2-6-Brazil)]NBA01941.1 tRNA (adenosine(37)-N6)-threonylcarbamoyltransferase complex dimerization s
MNTLIIDTSHKFLAVGLEVDGTLKVNKQSLMDKKQSEFLLTYVDEAIREAKLVPMDIDQVVITSGPGSYTGLRIGMTFAKTFALTNHKLKVYKVNTLLSLSGNNNGFSFIDARSGRVFGAYVSNGIVNDERIYMMDELKDIDLDLFGDLDLLDQKSENPRIIQNILDVKDSWEVETNIDLLVPNYIK